MSSGSVRGAPSRILLEGVPKVEFYAGGTRCPEDIPFPSCVRAYLEYLGDGLGCNKVECANGTRGLDCGYAFTMATSGAAWMLLWKPGWHMDNGDLRLVTADLEAPFRRTFRAVGYEWRYLPASAGEAALRDAITAGIGRGRPVLAFGVIGPPECCLVTGYDDGGDVLIGWNFFQSDPGFNPGGEFEESGEFRKRNWYADTHGLIAVGDRVAAPPLRDTLRESLRWALELAETPEVNGRHAGFAAYTAWADHLARDGDFATHDVATLMEIYGAHFTTVGAVAEGRWYGSEYLKMMARAEPVVGPHLLEAAACYVREHDLMWDVWNAAGGNGYDETRARRLAEPETRKAIIPLVEEARRKDIEAAGHLRAALAADERNV